MHVFNVLITKVQPKAQLHYHYHHQTKCRRLGLNWRIFYSEITVGETLIAMIYIHIVLIWQIICNWMLPTMLNKTIW